VLFQVPNHPLFYGIVRRI